MTSTMPDLFPPVLADGTAVSTSTVGAYVTHRVGVAGSENYMIVGRVIAVNDGVATCVGSADAVFEGGVPFRVFRFPVDDLQLHIFPTGDGLAGRYKVGLPEIARALTSSPSSSAIADAEAAARRPYAEQITSLEARVRMAQDEVDRLRTERDEFGSKVRELAIVKAQELGWCTPGLNEALEDLGLPAKDATYYVDVTVTATREVRVQVEAEDGEAAWRKVDEMDTDELNEAMRAYGHEPSRFWGDWDHTSHDSSTSVSQA